MCMIDLYGGWRIGLSKLHKMTLQILSRGGLWYPPPNGQRAFEDELWHDWRFTNLAVLDEIALREPTPAQYDTLISAIDHRLGKPFVVIANCPIDDLRTLYDDRIYSRLNCGTVLSLKGDRRQTEN